MLALLVRFFVGLVEVFSVVGDLANRRVGGRRNFHQIQPLLAGKLDRLKRRHHTQLPAIFIHHANFTRPDSIIHPNPVCLPKTPFRDKPTSENRAHASPKIPGPAPASSIPPLLRIAFRHGLGMGHKV